MAVAQLVDRSLPTPEVLIIVNNLSANCTIEKTKIKKEAKNGPSIKKHSFFQNYLSIKSKVLRSSQTKSFITLSPYFNMDARASFSRVVPFSTN